MTRFRLGRVAVTAAVARLVTPGQVLQLLRRHGAGDWGDLQEDEDRAANEDALRNDDRVLSRFVVGDHELYVITEADRSLTTVMLTEEY